MKIKACDYRLKRGQPVRQAVANGILADSHIAGTKIFNHIHRRDTAVAGDFGDKNLRQLINPCLNFGSAFFRVNIRTLVGALRRNDFYCFAVIILFKTETTPIEPSTAVSEAKILSQAEAIQYAPEQQAPDAYATIGFFPLA